MKRAVLLPALLLPLLLAAASALSPALGAEPAPGKTVMVTCRGAEDQQYACYVPSKYTSDKAWPILYCFSPNANGEAFVTRYRTVCEERGWIVVGSLNSKNGPWAPIQAAIDAMWADAEARFRLSKTRRYASGFSGGARVSFALAEMQPDFFAGVIAIGAGLHQGAQPVKEGLACWLMCGETDRNKRELDPLSLRLKEAGNAVHYENFPGGHVMPPTKLMEDAVRWIDDQADERKVERLREALARARVLVGEQNLLDAWHLLVTTLDALPDVKESRKEAEKLQKELERDPGLKLQVRAWREYEKAADYLKKHAEKLGTSARKRKDARKRLQKILDKWPGTLAAEAAGARIAEVDAIGAE